MSSKIVRDRVAAWAIKQGVSGVWKPCSDPEAGLRQKIGEEYGEYVAKNNPSELYDLLDVVNRLISLTDPFGILAGEHARKVARLGMFEDLIEWSPVPAEDESKVQR